MREGKNAKLPEQQKPTRTAKDKGHVFLIAYAFPTQLLLPTKSTERWISLEEEDVYTKI
jgi:hypothetical protein